MLRFVCIAVKIDTYEEYGRRKHRQKVIGQNLIGDRRIKLEALNEQEFVPAQSYIIKDYEELARDIYRATYKSVIYQGKRKEVALPSPEEAERMTSEPFFGFSTDLDVASGSRLSVRGIVCGVSDLSPVKSGQKSYGPKRDITLRLGDKKVNVTLWRDASCKTLQTGDNVSVLDGRVTQFAGTPTLNVQVGADIKVIPPPVEEPEDIEVTCISVVEVNDSKITVITMTGDEEFVDADSIKRLLTDEQQRTPIEEFLTAHLDFKVIGQKRGTTVTATAVQMDI